MNTAQAQKDKQREKRDSTRKGRRLAQEAINEAQEKALRSKETCYIATSRPVSPTKETHAHNSGFSPSFGDLDGLNF